MARSSSSSSKSSSSSNKSSSSSGENLSSYLNKTTTYGRYGGHKNSPQTSQPIKPIKEAKTPPTQQNPNPITKSTSGEGGFLSNVAQGFSFGIGSSIAHRIVGSIFGSSARIKTSSEQKQSEITNIDYIAKSECVNFQEEYLKCIKDDHNRVDKLHDCEFSLSILKECEGNK